MSSVRGSIALPAAGVPAEAADVIVQVEDVSRADAPSAVVGEVRLHRVPLSAGAIIPFALDIPEDRIDRRRSYSVRVHVDVSGSGQVETGDFVSTQSYPVLTGGSGDDVRIAVRRV